MKWARHSQGSWILLAVLVICTGLSSGDSPFKPRIRVPVRILPGGWREYNLRRRLANSGRPNTPGSNPVDHSVGSAGYDRPQPAPYRQHQGQGWGTHPVAGSVGRPVYDNQPQVSSYYQQERVNPVDQTQYNQQSQGSASYQQGDHEQINNPAVNLVEQQDYNSRSQGSSYHQQQDEWEDPVEHQGHDDQTQQQNQGRGNNPVENSAGQSRSNDQPQASEYNRDRDRRSDLAVNLGEHRGNVEQNEEWANPVGHQTSHHVSQQPQGSAYDQQGNQGWGNDPGVNSVEQSQNNDQPEASANYQAQENGLVGNPTSNQGEHHSQPLNQEPESPVGHQGYNGQPQGSSHDHQPEPEWMDRKMRGAETLTRVKRSSEWSDWSPCNTTCGVGYEYRQRACDAPAQCGGKPSETQFRLCNQGVQCEAEWTVWGPCNATCGSGYEIRQRLCPSPTGCGGSPTEKELRKCDGSGSECGGSKRRRAFIVTPIIIVILGGGLLIGFLVLKRKFSKAGTGAVVPKKKKKTPSKSKGKAPTGSDEPEDMPPRPPAEPDYVDVADLNTELVEEDEEGYAVPDEVDEEPEELEEPEGEPEYVDIIE